MWYKQSGISPCLLTAASLKGSGHAAPSKQSHQLPSNSAGVAGKPPLRGPAASRKVNTSKAPLQSSPLYAGSEDEDSECESSAHGSEPAQQPKTVPEPKRQQQHQPNKPAVPSPMQQSARGDLTGQGKPPSGRARQPAAASKTKDLQSQQGKKRADANDATNGFGLLSEEDDPQPQQVKAKDAVKPSKYSKPQPKPPGKLRPVKQANIADDDKSAHNEQLPQQSNARQQSRDNLPYANDDELMLADEGDYQAHVEAAPQQQPYAGPSRQEVLPQIAAVRQVEAAQESEQDPEWLAIAEKVLDAQAAQPDTTIASLPSSVVHRSPAPKHKYMAQHKRDAKVQCIGL